MNEVKIIKCTNCHRETLIDISTPNTMYCMTCYQTALRMIDYLRAENDELKKRYAELAKAAGSSIEEIKNNYDWQGALEPIFKKLENKIKKPLP